MKRFLLGMLVVVILIAIVLYASGYWSANIQEGSLPSVDIKAEGGSLPKIDVDSNLVIGTKETRVDAPGIADNGTTIEVPTVGVENEAAPANGQAR